MSVKQINVFLENEPGRLAEVTAALSEAKIDIRAVYITDSTTWIYGKYLARYRCIA